MSGNLRIELHQQRKFNNEIKNCLTLCRYCWSFDQQNKRIEFIECTRVQCKQNLMVVQ
jgi:hypothetical protein